LKEYKETKGVFGWKDEILGETEEDI